MMSASGIMVADPVFIKVRVNNIKLMCHFSRDSALLLCVDCCICWDNNTLVRLGTHGSIKLAYLSSIQH